MAGVDAGPTRQSRRDRTKEQDETKLRGDDDESNASGTETTIHVSDTRPVHQAHHEPLEPQTCQNQRIKQCLLERE